MSDPDLGRSQRPTTSDGGSPSERPVDLRAEMVSASNAVSGAGARQSAGGARTTPMTSDLSIDEELTLHSIGWEPIELVCGISVHSVPVGVWSWGQGEIGYASEAYARSFRAATSRIHQECAKFGGHGVVGVTVAWAVEPHHIEVSLTGTAVRPVGSKQISAESVFVSDLSGRDFTLLHLAGWESLGLSAGASFVYAPRRSMGAAMKQSAQNVELTNFTEAMYQAREMAMERMQQAAIAMGGTGVVEVKVTEGAMEFARHAVGFTAYGTVVRLAGDAHRRIGPTVVVPMDDSAGAFEATSLRGR